MFASRRLTVVFGSAITTLVFAASALAGPVKGNYGMIHAQATDPALHSTYRIPETDVGAGVYKDGVLSCHGQKVGGCIAGIKLVP